jgi:membrane protease YdiL (CAAX protease family)
MAVFSVSANSMKMIEYSSYVITLLIVCVGIVSWIRQRIRPWRSMGFIFDRGTIPDIIAGVVICGVAVSLIFMIDWIFNLIEVEGTAPPTDIFFKLIVFFLTASFIEEFVNRSLLVNGLSVFLKRNWLIIIFVSIFFGLGHVTGEGVSFVSVLSNALGGATYTIAFLGAKNLWFPWALHFSWNTFQYLFGYPVSGITKDPIILQTGVSDTILTGGAYGPEGGLIGLAFRIIILAALLCYLKKYRKIGAREILC